MPSKSAGGRKGADEKRARRPRQSNFTKDFEKDWDRYNGTGRFDMNDLRVVMAMLVANDGALPQQYRDHPLKDSKRWRDCRECHIHGDYLLVYRIVEDTVVLAAIGTHSELFGR